MTYSQLLSIIDQTGLSPESLAPKLGVSNMTIRRWRNERADKKVPKAYERLLWEGVQEMIGDGDMKSTGPGVAELLMIGGTSSVDAAMRNLGIERSDLTKGKNQSEGLVRILQKIGFSDRRRADVDKSHKKIWSFRKMGAEWRRLLSTLMEVIKSKRISHVDKLVAYGALFYLLCPFDLVPDHIPIFGLMDDFAVLNVAVAYYVARGFSAKKNGDDGVRLEG